MAIRADQVRELDNVERATVDKVEAYIDQVLPQSFKNDPQQYYAMFQFQALAKATGTAMMNFYQMKELARRFEVVGWSPHIRHVGVGSDFTLRFKEAVRPQAVPSPQQEEETA